jgi:hypothetical protein
VEGRLGSLRVRLPSMPVRMTVPARAQMYAIIMTVIDRSFGRFRLMPQSAPASSASHLNAWTYAQRGKNRWQEDPMPFTVLFASPSGRCFRGLPPPSSTHALLAYSFPPLDAVGDADDLSRSRFDEPHCETRDRRCITAVPRKSLQTP